MAAQRSSVVVCPGCGAENIAGAETCEKCQTALATLDMPGEDRDSEFAIPLSTLRLAKPQTVPPDTTVRKAVEILARDPNGAVVVTEGGVPIGIFTERDVLKRVAGNDELLDAPISGVMTHDPVLLRETDTVAVALNKMGDGGFRHIPLMDEGRLVGMVTVRDVITWMMTSYFD